MGKHKYIESPEKMWELFQAYKKQTKENPIIKNDFRGKDATEVKHKLERPLTMVGFENYVCDNTKISYPDLKAYFDEKNEAYKDYFPISSRIRSEIQQDQIEGGMAMIYSQSITARLNGLVEKTENKNTTTLNIPNLPDIGNRK